jgi:hypothetical protein
LVRKNFANGVTRGKNELKILDPSQTPIMNLIENAVIETYNSVYSLRSFLNEAHLKQTMKVLNLLYTYSREYELYFIYWLLPFQLAFSSSSTFTSTSTSTSTDRNFQNKTELIYDLSMYLDLYVKNLFPNWTELFTISNKIMKDLNTYDPEFYLHLITISKVNPKVNSKDFVNEIIYNESKQGNTHHLVYSEYEEGLSKMKFSREVLTEPTIFIRKWISEVFASVLHKNALLYVWDQLFMSLWAAYDFEMITKCILYLLRSQFMKSNNYDDMRRVFLEEPSNLYTSDIQSGFMHISSGRKENEISQLNKRNQIKKVDALVQRQRRLKDNPTEKTAINRKKVNLDPIGLKEMRLTLIIPKLVSLF